MGLEHWSLGTIGLYVYVPSVCVHVQNIPPDSVSFLI
jgi:hypothetical protein